MRVAPALELAFGAPIATVVPLLEDRLILVPNCSFAANPSICASIIQVELFHL